MALTGLSPAEERQAVWPCDGGGCQRRGHHGDLPGGQSGPSAGGPHQPPGGKTRASSDGNRERGHITSATRYTTVSLIITY